jgi:hypothetical protein
MLKQYVTVWNASNPTSMDTKVQNKFNSNQTTDFSQRILLTLKILIIYLILCNILTGLLITPYSQPIHPLKKINFEYIFRIGKPHF